MLEVTEESLLEWNFGLGNGLVISRHAASLMGLQLRHGESVVISVEEVEVSARKGERMEGISRGRRNVGMTSVRSQADHTTQPSQKS